MTECMYQQAYAKLKLYLLVAVKFTLPEPGWYWLKNLL